MTLPPSLPVESLPSAVAKSRLGWLAGAVLAIATLLAYANCYHGPFVFDDIAAIANNRSIRQLATALRPPAGGLTVSARPLLNLSFALNYAAGGPTVAGYHVVNVLIHLLGGLVLFAIVRRTWRDGPAWAAAGAALLWLLHPLQTESVTYLAQRAESLMALLYFATVYSFIRYTEEGARRAGWVVAGVASGGLAMACKEVAVTAPLVVLLYDRTFVSGAFRAAVRAHRRWYAALAATWLVAVGLALAGGDRGGTAGFGLGLRASFTYALAQFSALIRYLALAAWPHPLVFDYGTDWGRPDWSVVPSALVVLGLLAATIVALRHRPVAGFFGAWFFLILAPSSSVVPIATERMAEHRMYLPLAAVMVGAVVLLQRRLGAKGAIVIGAAALAFGVSTFQRNRSYASALGLWAETVAQRPQNPSARVNLGYSLFEAGRFTEAIGQFDAALALDPDNAKAFNHRGRARASLGQMAQADADLQAALRLRPDYAEAHNNLGVLFAIRGDRASAVAQFREAIRLAPDYPEARANLARALGP